MKVVVVLVDVAAADADPDGEGPVRTGLSSRALHSGGALDGCRRSSNDAINPSPIDFTTCPPTRSTCHVEFGEMRCEGLPGSGIEAANAVESTMSVKTMVAVRTRLTAASVLAFVTVYVRRTRKFPPCQPGAHHVSQALTSKACPPKRPASRLSAPSASSTSPSTAGPAWEPRSSWTCSSPTRCRHGRATADGALPEREAVDRALDRFCGVKMASGSSLS